MSVVALLTSALTLFSGFGLGTLLLPAFLLFFPVDISVAMTAVVHLLNNLFKLVLVGRNASWRVVLRFGAPAIVAALGGATFLMIVTTLPVLASYEMFGRTQDVRADKLVVAVLICVFAVVEVLPAFRNVQLGERYLPLGGVLSGFFGGISGHQGALRAMFLVRAGLSREAYIATGVVIACLVDFTRISVYLQYFAGTGLRENIGLITAATMSAFAGAYIGNRLVKNITMHQIQIVVSILLVGTSLGIGSGLI